MSHQHRIAVFGASGYVGGRLIHRLLDDGHEVRAVTRASRKLEGYPWSGQVEVVEADLLEPDTIAAALEGCDVAYYLVHSMESDDYAERDRRAASNFTRAAAASTLSQVVYLSGMGGGDLSEHLASRQEVGEILRTGTVPVTELRAAVIIGSGSLSFEMLRHLTEVLPIMVTPRWVRTRTQPIAIRDVLTYLIRVIDQEAALGQTWEIGGDDVLSYQELMQIYAEEAGLRRRLIVPVPALTPTLSARWVGLVTPLSNQVAKHLVKSLRTEVVVHDSTAEDLLRVEPIGVRESLARAIRSTRSATVPTRWHPSTWEPADPLPSDPQYALGPLVKDRRAVETAARPQDLYWAFCRIGGEVGYYSTNWAWQIRGLADQLTGGAGLRRGRRHPEHLRLGEPLDFWRVADVVVGKRLQLVAEMRLPGRAWLEWEIEPLDEGSRLVQTAWFSPKGLWGRLYWYALLPAHAVVFPQMIAGIVRAAEQRMASDDGVSLAG